VSRPALVLATALLALTGCTGTSSDAAATASTGDEPTGTLTVFAAASLTDVFTELGEQLEADHPGLDVRFNFAGSSALAAQIEQGAPADVFASADEAQMDRVADAGLATPPEVFAGNPLMLAFPPDNPGDLTRPEKAGAPTLAELLDHDVTLAVCAPEVPCGAAAAELLGEAGLSDVPDTYEDDVRAVLTKVQLGEVDAGLVYLSDVHAAGDTIVAFAFEQSADEINRYPVATLEDAPNPAAAHAFVELLLSEEGQQTMKAAGFLEP
jgi:molybdate transport system substrate-binding protein